MAPNKKPSKASKEVTKSFNLMRLTPELRNMVYRFALTAPNEIHVSETITYPPAGIFPPHPVPVKCLKVTTFLLAEGKKHPTTVGRRWHIYAKKHNVHLLRASKQVLAEAKGFLYFHNSFVLKTASAARHFVSSVSANVSMLSTLAIGTCHLDRDWRVLDLLKPATKLRKLHITITGGTGRNLTSLVNGLLLFAQDFLAVEHKPPETDEENDDNEDGVVDAAAGVVAAKCPSRRKCDCVCNPSFQRARLSVFTFDLDKGYNGVDFGSSDGGRLRKLTPEQNVALKKTVMKEFETRVSIRKLQRQIEVLQEKLSRKQRKGVKLVVE